MRSAGDATTRRSVPAADPRMAIPNSALGFRLWKSDRRTTPNRGVRFPCCNSPDWPARSCSKGITSAFQLIAFLLVRGRKERATMHCLILGCHLDRLVALLAGWIVGAALLLPGGGACAARGGEPRVQPRGPRGEGRVPLTPAPPSRSRWTSSPIPSRRSGGWTTPSRASRTTCGPSAIPSGASSSAPSPCSAGDGPVGPRANCLEE